MSKYKEQVINFFDQRTAYDLEGDSHPYEANKLLEFASDIQDGQTVLDLATGTGLVAIAAAEKTASRGSVTIEYDRRGKYIVLAVQKEELQSEYQQAINDLVTEEGLWSDRSLLFVKAQK